MQSRRRALGAVSAAVGAASLLLLARCGSGGGGGGGAADPDLGERLFRATRFAQSFAVRVAGRPLDDPLPGSDPVVDETVTTGDPLPGPYAGLAMDCAACHLSDEMADVSGGGTRTYADF